MRKFLRGWLCWRIWILGERSGVMRGRRRCLSLWRRRWKRRWRRRSRILRRWMRRRRRIGRRRRKWRRRRRKRKRMRSELRLRSERDNEQNFEQQFPQSHDKKSTNSKPPSPPTQTSTSTTLSPNPSPPLTPSPNFESLRKSWACAWPKKSENLENSSYTPTPLSSSHLEVRRITSTLVRNCCWCTPAWTWARRVSL